MWERHVKVHFCFLMWGIEREKKKKELARVQILIPFDKRIYWRWKTTTQRMYYCAVSTTYIYTTQPTFPSIIEFHFIYLSALSHCTYLCLLFVWYYMNQLFIFMQPNYGWSFKKIRMFIAQMKYLLPVNQILFICCRCRQSNKYHLRTYSYEKYLA